jgi:aspartate ammonia-lyase
MVGPGIKAVRYRVSGKKLAAQHRTMPRQESDSLGSVEVPDDAYYGSFTVRASQNFDITDETVLMDLIRKVALVKKAAAAVNADSGDLEDEKADAIIEAVEEVIAGEHDEQFILDPIQAGAGTPLHMNVNEVLANRATELLGGKKGEYRVHPNDDVNMGQSTNNVVPTALRLALLDLSDELLEAIDGLAETFRDRGEDHEDTVKVGRTHLQDAVPVTVGQEFDAWARTCEKGRERIERSRDELREMGIGGNAVGTGINTRPSFRKDVVGELAELTGRELRATGDNVQLTQSMAPFSSFTGEIETFASDLLKVTDDLQVLNSGPVAGIGELDLPEVEPGSSIMPGKVNPSIVEATRMTCLQAIGNHETVAAASREGDLEMNVMAPVIARNAIGMVSEMTKAVEMLAERCITDLEVDMERIDELFEGSTAVATALSPYIGYDRTAEAVHAALDGDRSVREIVADRGWMTDDELETVLDPERMTAPHGIDTDLKEAVQERLEENDDG